MSRVWAAFVLFTSVNRKAEMPKCGGLTPLSVDFSEFRVKDKNCAINKIFMKRVIAL